LNWTEALQRPVPVRLIDTGDRQRLPTRGSARPKTVLRQPMRDVA